MRNDYLENLLVRIKEPGGIEKTTRGERALAWAYESSARAGFEVIAFNDILREADVEDFVNTLWESNAPALYITSQYSNMLNTYVRMDEMGLHVRGAVTLENPQYKKDLERWGESFESQYIPAFRMTF